MDQGRSLLLLRLNLKGGGMSVQRWQVKVQLACQSGSGVLPSKHMQQPKWRACTSHMGHVEDRQSCRAYAGTQALQGDDEIPLGIQASCHQGAGITC